MSKNNELYPWQAEALKKMSNGCILNGGVGSGKSRTGLAYYYTLCGGKVGGNDYYPMTDPIDLYIITTAKKRDDLEWEVELANFLMSPKPEHSYYGEKVKVVIDSWNNIKNYLDCHENCRAYEQYIRKHKKDPTLVSPCKDCQKRHEIVKDSFFIFDEDKITGTGAWVKAFWKLAKVNKWIVLSATPGDRWADYGPIFVANGFYRNITEFRQEHVTYKPYSNFPQIDHTRYRNTGRLVRLRNKILIPMDFKRHTVRHDEYIYCDYDVLEYKRVCKERTNPFNAFFPIANASEYCQVLRRVVNDTNSRKLAVLEIMDEKPKVIIFYNYDYELEGLIELCESAGIDYAQWNGHAHEEIPSGDRWMYLVQYNAGSEGWNYVGTDTIIFYSQNYSYKMTEQASGRIDRLNTPFVDLYYYHFLSRAPIDLSIMRALKGKKKFNEGSYCKGIIFG